MAIKDLDTSENKDRYGKTNEEQKESGDITARSSKDGKETGGTDIKNAHATGDGSYGRNDESLPDEDEEAEKGESNY